MTQSLRVYLANLTHFREGRPSSETIPLNVGYLAAALMKDLGEAIEVQIFSEPRKLERAMAEQVPDVLGTSNYVWSSHLNYVYLEHYKSIFPSMAAIMGGPHYPGRRDLQEKFLRDHDSVDFYIASEGEVAVSNLMRELLRYDGDVARLKEADIPGCHYLRDGAFVDGGRGERTFELDELPSPYSNGLFDSMLASGYVPMIQTNRGCPFSCTFCHSASTYYNKLNCFSLERVVEDLDYISTRSRAHSLQICDDNFGILDRDKTIACKIRECRDMRGWPVKVNLSTSKVRKDKVFDAISPLGDSILFSASMQSANLRTLQEVKRKNLSFSEFQSIIADFDDAGVPSLCELIVPMPEETKQSMLHAIGEAIDHGIDDIGVYTCMLLPNTPLVEDPYYARHEMQRAVRVLPRDFGVYLGRKVIETEEVCVATRTMPLEDYLYVRSFSFVVSSLYSLAPFKELMAFLTDSGVRVFDVLCKVNEYLRSDTSPAGVVYDAFATDARDELWEKEGALLEFYEADERFDSLLAGERGANLIQKYQAMVLNNLQPFGIVLAEVIGRDFPAVLKQPTTELIHFAICVRGEPFEQERTLRRNFSFDILEWLTHGDFSSRLEEFEGPTPITFYHTDEQRRTLRDYGGLYGDDGDDARGKILTRINPSSLYRKYRHAEQRESKHL